MDSPVTLYRVTSGQLALVTFFVPNRGKLYHIRRGLLRDIFNRPSVFRVSVDFCVFVGKGCARYRHTDCDKYNRNRYKSISLFKFIYSFCILFCTLDLYTL